MFWESVGASIMANIATLVLTVATGWVLLTARRRSLLRFWGIHDARKLRIYLSHLRIAPGGALDAHGNPRSYQGSVVTQLESETAALLKSLFLASLPGDAVQPNWFKALLLVSADVQILPSPDSAAQVEPDGTVVSLGSPAYNGVSAAIEGYNSPVRFGPNNSTIQLPGNLTATNPRQAFVVRLRAGGRSWFYAAGLSEAGTAAAVHYLVKSWRRLDRLHRNSPAFFVALEVVGNDYRHTRVIGEAAVDNATTA